jgi:hypothetical protein
MRFFSNEAQENVDDNNADDNADDRAKRDPAGTTAVPQQRAGSPWQHDTDTSPQPTAVGTSPQPTVVGTSPQPTAVGTSPVGDANTIRPSEDTDPAGTDKKDDKIDAALEDRGTFDDPHVAETGPGVDEKADHKLDDKADDKLDDKADHKLDDQADEEVDGKPDEKADEHEPEKDAKVSPEPEATTPSGPVPLFPATDTQALKDRWRDVQLRFVDDPKGATAEAAGLVDEAVDKLSKALRDQRGSLAKGTDDTEQLRVELRGYRDILDRLLGL